MTAASSLVEAKALHEVVSDAASVPEWARERVAKANRILLDTLEDALVRRAHLEAQIARIEVALRLDDASVLREGDVPEEAESDA